jgi:hypothetical protein
VNTPGLSAAEQASLSSLSYHHTPPEPTGLRLVYSRTNVEDLVGSIARTRRELQAALTLRTELAHEASTAASEVTRLREQEQRQVLALDRYINSLANVA